MLQKPVLKWDQVHNFNILNVPVPSEKELFRIHPSAEGAAATLEGK